MSGDRDAHIWAAQIAQAYFKMAGKPFTVGIEAWLARSLVKSVARCIDDATQTDDWGIEHVNIAIVRWEHIARSRIGPRLAGVDYSNGAVTMA